MNPRYPIFSFSPQAKKIIRTIYGKEEKNLNMR